MNPFYWSYRFSFLAGLLVCAALLAFALYTEHYWGLFPCPLCIFQRVGFLVMGVFFLLGGVFAPPGRARWIFTVGALVGGLFGIVVAARHLWIQSLPAEQVPSCGPPLNYMFSTFPLARALRLVFTGSGECATVDPVLGLPMPAWTLIWFVLLSALAVLVSLRARSSQSRRGF